METVTISRRHATEIYGACEQLAPHIVSCQFKISHALARCLASLRGEVEAVHKADKASRGFEQFSAARQALLAKHAMKDDKGNPVTAPNGEVALTDAGAWASALGELRSKHAEAIAARDDQVDARDKVLDEKIEVKVHQIPLIDIEAEGVFREPPADQPGLPLAKLMEPLIGTVIKG